MKGKNAIVASSLWILLTLVLSGCPGTLPPPCCPLVKDFKVDDPWVCPDGCPGGGKTRISYVLEFYRQKELCEPPETFTVSIINVTDNLELPPLKVDHPKVGVISGKGEITLAHDTEFQLSAKGGDTRCGDVSGTLKVNVVNKGDNDTICFSGRLDWPKCTYPGGYKPYGPGVLIDHVHNPSHLAVRVTKDSTSDFVRPYADGYGFSGSKASGDWSMGLTSQEDCNMYASRPAAQQTLCVHVYLKCNCP